MLKDTTILVAEDLLSSRHILLKMLRKNGFSSIYEAENGSQAIEILKNHTVDLVLLDIMMPEINGHEVLEKMKADPRLCRIPVIMITALDDMGSAVRCIEMGAEDYLIKPFNPTLLNARISATLEKLRLRQIEKEYLRNYDPVTGLPNRGFFLKRLNEEIDRSRLRPTMYAVFFVRLKKYAVIAESLGQNAADEYLCTRAAALARLFHENSMLARIGDNAFSILLFNLKSAAQILSVAERITEELSLPLSIAGHEITGWIQVGVVYDKCGDTDSEAMLRDAILASREVLPPGGFKVFNDTMQIKALARLKREPELKRALSQNEFLLYYQPIVHLQNTRIAGYEALLRWRHPDRGLLLPDEFIQIAEDTRLIIPLGNWVIRQVCRQAANWKKLDGNREELSISINISAHQLNSPEFISVLRSALDENAIDGCWLHLELTETVLIETVDKMTGIIDSLHEMGGKASIDDFGKGYCALNYLHRFAFDTLKIDKTFIQGIHKSNRNREIVNSTIKLAHRLSMKVIAEGIETDADAEVLRKLNCDYGQGYLFHSPLPDNEAKQLLL